MSKGTLSSLDAPDECFFFVQADPPVGINTKYKLSRMLRAQTGRKYRLGPYKKTGEEKAKEDPLKMLEQMAQKAGIDVSVTGQ